MKFLAASLILFAGHVSAGNKPELTINLKEGTYGSITEAVAPVVKLSGEGNGLEYGLSVDLSDGLPKSIWGQKSSSAAGWNLKTKAELTHGKYDFDGEDTGAYVSVQGNTDDEEAFVWGSAAISKGDVKALKVGGKKIIGTDAGRIMVAPRYNFETSSAKVVLGFEKDDTNAYLTVSEDDKDLLVEQTIDDANSATLKLGTSGFIAATLTNESDLGSTKLTLTTDEIDVEIKSDGWVAGMSCDKNLVNASPEIRFGKSHTFSI